MRYEETCSCGAQLVVVDDDGRYSERGQAQLRIDKRVKDWRRNHKHEVPMTHPTPPESSKP